MRFFIVAISACLLASTSIKAEDLKVANWNLNGFKPIKSKNLNNIINGLKTLDADIYVLSEVNPVSHTKKIAKALSKDGKCYKYKAPKQDTSRHHIGFVYSCDIETSNSGRINGSDLNERGYREAVYMKAKANNFDFVLVGSHLKAGKSEKSQAERAKQLEFVANHAHRSIASGEKDILVTGTFNTGHSQDNETEFKALNKSGHFRSVSHSMAGSNYISKNGNLSVMTGGFAYTAADAVEYKDGSAGVVPLHQVMDMSLADFRQNVSDHLPMVALFDTSTDND